MFDRGRCFQQQLGQLSPVVTVAVLSLVSIITAAAETHKVPPALALGLAYRESSLVPTARGDKGERGLFQLMPATARAVGFEGDLDGLFEPSVNAFYGLKHLAGLLQKYKSIPAAVSAYQHGTPTRENDAYTLDVLAYARRFESSLFFARASAVLFPVAVGVAAALFSGFDLEESDSDGRET